MVVERLDEKLSDFGKRGTNRQIAAILEVGHCKTLGVAFGNVEVEAPINTMADTLEEAKIKKLLDT